MRYISARHIIAVATLALGIISANLWQTTQHQHNPHRSTVRCNGVSENQVLAVERDYIRAFTERDVVKLDRVLADDFSAFGGRMNKAQRLALLSDPNFMVNSLETFEVEVSVQGDAEAWVGGIARMTGSYGGREFRNMSYRFKRHYERRSGDWQIVSCEFSSAE